LQRLLASGGSAAEAAGVVLRLGDYRAAFEIGPTRLTTALLQGDYPNYASLVQSSYPNRLTVGREALLDGLRRVRLMVRDVNSSVRMALQPNGIELTVITPDLGQATEQLDAKYEGAEMTIAFNPAYLIDGLEAIDGDEVILEAQDAVKAALLRGTEAPDYLYLLMPVRVS
jgi:DNA polymerase-3 subunit beta